MIRSVLTIAKRELRGYFDYPTAYVLVVAFLSISLFLTFRNMYAGNVASMRPLFDLLPVLFAVFVPAATMRSLAEERRGGTLEWLLAHPVSELEVVVGKFLGDWAFVLLALAGTLPTAIGVLMASDADPGIVWAQYIGGALLAGQLVALGLWASSITRNQITAFIVAAASSFVLFLIGLQVVQIGLPPLVSGAFAHLSVVSHFQNVARGVIDLRDVLYFASTGALFLAFATGAVARERLSRGGADHR
ncbi:MAG: ABC transporter permease, partial [Gemmatimonadetes bacterium]|nr:ABC transporter permease [Gemmatimonadota bacterium]